LVLTPLCPSDISPKYDNGKLGCEFIVWLVEFGGDSAMGISLQLGKNSSFIIHTSSLLFRREKVLSALGLRVIRFRNDEVIRGLSAVAGKIRKMLFF
jgi:hypothetical protein